jgi:hypothetical protein
VLRVEAGDSGMAMAISSPCCILVM